MKEGIIEICLYLATDGLDKPGKTYQIWEKGSSEVLHEE